MADDPDTTAAAGADAIGLRTATRTAHERLHEEPQLAALAAGTLGSAGYRQLLLALARYHGHLDRRILAAPTLGALEAGFGYRYLPRLPVLLEDLEALGITPPDRGDTHRGATGHAELLGLLYVVEGATFGATLLDRGAERVLGPDRLAGRGFFRIGRQSGRQPWRALQPALRACACDPAHRKAMHAAAVEAMRRLLDELDPEPRPEADAA